MPMAGQAPLPLLGRSPLELWEGLPQLWLAACHRLPQPARPGMSPKQGLLPLPPAALRCPPLAPRPGLAPNQGLPLPWPAAGCRYLLLPGQGLPAPAQRLRSAAGLHPPMPLKPAQLVPCKCT